MHLAYKLTHPKEGFVPPNGAGGDDRIVFPCFARQVCLSAKWGRLIDVTEKRHIFTKMSWFAARQLSANHLS